MFLGKARCYQNGGDLFMGNINIKIDNELKEQAEYWFSEFGMDATKAITMFYQAVIREQRIPFDIPESDSFYSEANMAHLQQSIDQINKGERFIHELIEDKKEPLR